MEIPKVYYKTIRHFFPEFFKWIDQIPDWRDQKRIKYKARDMIATGLSIFLLKFGSRRAMNEQRGREEFVRNCNGLFSAEGIAHCDSLNYFLKPSDYKHLHKVRIKMIRQLIRNKVLDPFRLLGQYILIAFDGTRTICFGQRHCKECSSQKLSNGETVYYHPILEAKVVCWNGFSISIGTEFMSQKDGQQKQDCELAAWKRLVKKIKKDFPQLRICMLADGLYACEPVLQTCKDYGWAYLIVLTDDRLTTIWEEVRGLKKLQKENYHRRQLTEPGERKKTEQYWWTLDIEYHQQKVNVLEYRAKKEGEEKVSRWAWVTNIKVKAKNCIELSQGGRLRWKIENEGFNTQKNGGYELEHVYSHNINAQKNFYLLMQIAHIINQLVEKGSLLKEVYKGRLPSLKTILRDFLAELKVLLMPWEVWKKEDASSFQIRFDTS